MVCQETEPQSWSLLRTVITMRQFSFLRSLDTKFFHARAQCARIDVEDLRCALISVDDPGGFIESAQDMIALDVLERFHRGNLHAVVGPHHRIIDVNDGTASPTFASEIGEFGF